ncbi:hypothetical protein [Novosphingobium sp. Leaf2]
MACDKMMEVARFTPALDKDGKPVASYYATTISWTISQFP